MITVAGALVGIGLVRLAGQREVWLRAAILAQVADLVSFAAMWEHAQGELNPLGGFVRDTALLLLGGDSGGAYGGAYGASVVIAAILLAALKLALIGFLIRVDPDLGRYRRVVLLSAITAGTLGAASNVIAHPNAAGSLLVVGLFAVVAIRAPARFGDLARLAAGAAGTTLLAIGGLAAISFIPYARFNALCADAACPPGLASAVTMLGTALIAASLLGLWYTARFGVRALTRRGPAHPELANAE